MFQGLRTVIYPVTKIAGATAWYRKVAGCDPCFEQPCHVGFSVGGVELGLIPDGTPDAAAEVERLLALGAVRAPYGNLLGVIENPHFDLSKVA